jgi:hypothetical protein
MRPIRFWYQPYGQARFSFWFGRCKHQYQPFALVWLSFSNQFMLGRYHQKAYTKNGIDTGGEYLYVV